MGAEGRTRAAGPGLSSSWRVSARRRIVTVRGPPHSFDPFQVKTVAEKRRVSPFDILKGLTERPFGPSFLEETMEATFDSSSASRAETPAWQSWVGWVSAAIMAVLWLSAGLWKMSDISGFQLKMHQLLVPTAWTLPGTLALVTAEVFAGILLLRPAWRRLGGLFSIALLLVFMAYMAINYTALQGEDCTCFPWLERAVGPAFFWSDGAMVVVSLLAAWFAPAMAKLGQAKKLLVGVVALTAVAFAYDRFGPEPGADVPATITVEGEDYDLRQGKVVLYFFNPTCLHCLDVGIQMSAYTFTADFVGIPTQDFDYSQGFLEDSGLKGTARLSPDLELLKQTFPFEDVPYVAVIEDGKILERFQFFDDPGFADALRGHGMIQ